HHALVLAQVFVALEQERVIVAIAAPEHDLPGRLLAWNHLDDWREGADGNEREPGFVRVCAMSKGKKGERGGRRRGRGRGREREGRKELVKEEWEHEKDVEEEYGR